MNSHNIPGSEPSLTSFQGRMQRVLQTGEGDTRRARIVLENARREREASLTGLRGVNRTAALEALGGQAL
jgi:hypothetical protein